MPDKQSVNSSVSDTEKNQASPSHEGESAYPKELEKKVREQLRGEYSRKESELSEKYEEAQSRLAELEDKFRLSESDKLEQAKLQNVSMDIERELHILDTDPQYRAYNEKIRRTTEATKTQAITEAKAEFYAEQVDDFLDDTAEELEIEPKELRKELNKLVKVEHMKMNPMRRTKAVLKEFKTMRDRAKRDEESRAKEEEERRFSEGNGRAAREETYEQATKRGASVAERLKALGKA